MNSALRALLMIFGALLIVGATIIFLRELGTVLPPNVSSTLVFVAGIGLLWVAFRPWGGEVPEGGADGPGVAQPVETPYDRAALARLQAAFDSESKPPGQPIG